MWSNNDLKCSSSGFYESCKCGKFKGHFLLVLLNRLDGKKRTDVTQFIMLSVKYTARDKMIND